MERTRAPAAGVRALLQERQDRRKAELDAHWRDVQFAVGYKVLLDKEHMLPLLDGANRHQYCLDLSATRHIFYKFSCIFSVERLSLTYAAPLALRGRTA